MKSTVGIPLLQPEKIRWIELPPAGQGFGRRRTRIPLIQSVQTTDYNGKRMTTLNAPKTNPNGGHEFKFGGSPKLVTFIFAEAGNRKWEIEQICSLI